MWISWMIIAVMVGIECVEAGLNTLTKVAMTSGMSDFVFVVYSNSLALLFLLPSTLIYHRKRPSPKLTFLIVCRIFILGLLSFDFLTACKSEQFSRSNSRKQISENGSSKRFAKDVVQKYLKLLRLHPHMKNQRNGRFTVAVKS
ncbi:hypothetical protein TEA_026000 [Camellia sinensis var. sinensis]|uniref:WAT1-related protein n=1 Tax=Camellia sinensis var. sinensis TaxID=542762 RepID=A0A4S4DR19_CAMSN|nr:hypothetical protein TEA_026000 [Camellia sinensis var. sinensis]